MKNSEPQVSMLLLNVSWFKTETFLLLAFVCWFFKVTIILVCKNILVFLKHFKKYLKYLIYMVLKIAFLIIYKIEKKMYLKLFFYSVTKRYYTWNDKIFILDF